MDAPCTPCTPCCRIRKSGASALEGSNLLARADPVSLAGAGAFVLLLVIGGALLVRWLARQRTERAAAGRPVP